VKPIANTTAYASGSVTEVVHNAMSDRIHAGAATGRKSSEDWHLAIVAATAESTSEGTIAVSGASRQSRQRAFAMGVQ
jgi:hypothetical protein